MVVVVVVVVDEQYPVFKKQLNQSVPPRPEERTNFPSWSLSLSYRDIVLIWEVKLDNLLPLRRFTQGPS